MELTGKSIPTLIAATASPASWVDQHADYLYSYALGRLGDEQDARDLVQETFLGALENLQGFKGNSSERTWLTAILRNKIFDRYRKRSSGLVADPLLNKGDDSRDYFDQADGHWNLSLQPASFTSNPDDPMQEKDFNRIMRGCLDKLPALWISVFTMKHVDEADSKVICEELRLTPSNFWVIIHRAKLNLRQCLQKHWL